MQLCLLVECFSTWQDLSCSATGSDPATAEKVVRRADSPGSLSHMCVLDIENGADHFVLVEGTYRASFFGLTISTLSDREASMAEDELDACECSGDNMKHIFTSPFVTHQWAAIPQPLKKMLHFLSRCALLCTACSKVEPTLSLLSVCL